MIGVDNHVGLPDIRGPFRANFLLSYSFHEVPSFKQGGCTMRATRRMVRARSCTWQAAVQTGVTLEGVEEGLSEGLRAQGFGPYTKVSKEYPKGPRTQVIGF